MCSAAGAGAMGIPAVLLVLLVLLQLQGNVQAQKDRSTAVEDLYEGLLESYHIRVAPTAEKGTPTTVKGVFSLLMIRSLESSQVFTTMGTLVLEWTDPRLSWNPDEHGGIKRLHLPAKMIWTPELVLINGAEDILQDFEKFQMVVSHTGLIHWEPSGYFKSSCALDTTYYPSDQQRCSLVFGTLTHSTKEVNLTLSSQTVNLDSYEINGEYELMATKSRRTEFMYDCCPNERYSNLQFEVTVKRRSSYYVLNLILPTVLTSGLLLTMFLSPPQYKVEIGLVVLISFRLLMLDVAHDMPKTSDHIPLLSIYLSFTMVLGTVAMAMAVFVLSLTVRGESPLPGWLRKLVNILGKIVCVKKRPVETDGGEEDQKAVVMENLAGSPDTAGREKMNHQREWRFVADVLDRVFFWILLITMVITFFVFLVPVL